MEVLHEQPMDAERRIAFLELRADAQGNNGYVADSVRLGCKGTLLRDAASLALMIEQYDRAAVLLHSAGEAWAGIGLFAGYLLLQLSGDHAWTKQYQQDLQQIERLFEWRFTNTTSPPPRANGRAYLTAATWSPRQLLNLYQALPAAHHASELAESVKRHARVSLDDLSASATVGDFQVSNYLLVWDAVAQGHFDEPAQDALVALLQDRARRLEVAQADTHHWYRAVNSAGFVDFDLMALGLMAIQSNAADKLDNIMRLFSPHVALPWLAVQGLRQGVSL